MKKRKREAKGKRQSEEEKERKLKGEREEKLFSFLAVSEFFSQPLAVVKNARDQLTIKCQASSSTYKTIFGKMFIAEMSTLYKKPARIR